MVRFDLETKWKGGGNKTKSKAYVVINSSRDMKRAQNKNGRQFNFSKALALKYGWGVILYFSIGGLDA